MWSVKLGEAGKHMDRKDSNGAKRVLLFGGGLIGSGVGARLMSQDGWQLTLVEPAQGVREAWEQWVTDMDGDCGIYSELEALQKTEAFDWIVLAVPESSCAMLLVVLAEALESGHISLTLNGGIVPLNSSMGALQYVASRLGLQDRYVPVHPIAGSERRGFSPLRLLQLEGAPAVMGASGAMTPVVAGVRGLVSALGLETIEMTLQDHDAYYAATSHLNHLIAVLQSALLPERPEVAPPSGAVNRRLAKSDAGLWADVLWHNRREVLRAIEGLDALLDLARQSLCAPSPESLEVLWRRCQSGDTLELWRDEIDQIDDQVAVLLSERLRWVQRIGGVKRSRNRSIEDKGREAQVLRRVVQGGAVQTQDSQTQQALAAMYQTIMAQCRAVQRHG